MPLRAPRPTRWFLACLLLALLRAAPALLAQSPAADWRTLQTAHFRLVYPRAAEAWARRAAARLEAVRERVVAEVGYTPPRTIDVLVSDPRAEANGSAWPLLGRPRLVLWTSSPGPDSVVGAYRDWQELLLVHETTHLAHLLRPSRNPGRRLAASLLPLGPIALAAPRWVVEGYATLTEGRLTGSGRPNGDLRAAVLRRRAAAGRLPSYDGLNADEHTWLGPSMAYLAGSAFLEWLEQRAGPESLRHLWARLSARTPRDFDDAFRGVFGDPPHQLYDRFRAELTWRAIELEHRLGEGRREGELWQPLSGSTGAPAVSPDGESLAVVVRPVDRPARLVIWSTRADEEAIRRHEEAAARRRGLDPEDVAAVETGPPPHRRLFELPESDGVAPSEPRWLPTGSALLLVRFEPDADGFLHPDLFRWTPASGRLERLTHGADLREADPAPDGSWVVAVRKRDGLDQLVRVDLTSGAVGELTAPSLEVTYDQPRLSPDGRRLAVVRHAAGEWKLVLRELASGEEQEVPTPPGASVASPAWSPDGRTLYASVGQEGLIDLDAFDPATGERAELTSSAGAAFAPAPTRDGSALYYLSLEPDGLDLRRLDLSAARPPSERPAVAGLGPAVRPPAPASPPLPAPASEPPPGEPYGLGRQEVTPLAAGVWAPSGGSVEAGIRVGDLVGRLDSTLLFATGGGAQPAGVALRGTWRGWPVELSAQLFASRERPSRQPDRVPGLGDSLDLDRRGGEIAVGWHRRAGAATLELSGGGLLERVSPLAGGDLDRRLGFVTMGWSEDLSRGRWHLPWEVETDLAAGTTEGDSWTRRGVALGLALGHDESSLRLLWRRRAVAGAGRDLDRLTLGGTDGDLLPASLLAGSVAQPALPFALRVGDEHEGQRLELHLASLPLPLFYQRDRLWPEGAPRGPWLAAAGAEWRWAGGPLPLVGLPAFDLDVGLAYLLDRPLAHRVRGWIGLTWKP